MKSRLIARGLALYWPAWNPFQDSGEKTTLPRTTIAVLSLKIAPEDCLHNNVDMGILALSALSVQIILSESRDSARFVTVGIKVRRGLFLALF